MTSYLGYVESAGGTPMTDLQALSNAATPGPWRTVPPLPAQDTTASVAIVGEHEVRSIAPGATPAEDAADAAYIVALVNAHREGRLAASPSPDTDAGLDVASLRRALYTVSQRHDWEHVEDREDRTQEIADEYAIEVAR